MRPLGSLWGILSGSFSSEQNESKTLEALQSMGFSGEQIWVKIIREGEDKRGATLAKTISLRDFVKLVTFEAMNKRNIQAIVLLGAFAEVGIERVIEDVLRGFQWKQHNFAEPGLLEKLGRGEIVITFAAWGQTDWLNQESLYL